MEFDASRVFTALNADKLRAGDKVIVADTLDLLKRCVKDSNPISTIRTIEPEDFMFRFAAENDGVTFALAYLVERAKTENRCAICAKSKNGGRGVCVLEEGYGCNDYELKVKKYYRPFRDVDELIKVWEEKTCATPYWGKGADLVMPHIWVKKRHDDTDRGKLIISFSNNGCSVIDVDEIEVLLLEDLFNIYTFLDGFPCGVEE